ncbi:MAG: hypothetical protein Q9179_006748, partial [Wetmoreana sp. 5 TL-2023]
MAISESVRVREALEILSNVSEDELKPHWSKAQETFRKLKKQMQASNRTATENQPSTVTDDCMPSSPSKLQSERPSSVAAGSTQPQNSPGASVHSEKQVVPLEIPPREYSKPVRNFMCKVMKTLEDLKKFVDNENPTKEMLQQDLLEIDVRITDIVTTAGRQSKDDISKFDQLRRGLGMYSLASEYELWLLKHTGQSTAPNGRPLKGHSGPLVTYAKQNEYRFGRAYGETLRYAIRVGRLLLDYERKSGGSGYLLVLIFDLHGCQAIGSQKLEELAHALRSHSDVSRFAEHSKYWIDQRRREYDKYCAELNNTLISNGLPNVLVNLGYRVSESAHVVHLYHADLYQRPAGLMMSRAFREICRAALDKTQSLSVFDGNCADINDNYMGSISHETQPPFDGNCADINDNYMGGISHFYVDIINNYTRDVSHQTQPMFSMHGNNVDRNTFT